MFSIFNQTNRVVTDFGSQITGGKSSRIPKRKGLAAYVNWRIVEAESLHPKTSTDERMNQHIFGSLGLCSLCLSVPCVLTLLTHISE